MGLGWPMSSENTFMLYQEDPNLTMGPWEEGSTIRNIVKVSNH